MNFYPLIASATIFALAGSLFAVIPDASGRLPGAFSFEVDDYYLDGSNAYFVAESGSKSILPITIKNKGQPNNYVFHTTFGNQLDPPPQPEGINIWFEPDHLSLEPNEKRTINLVIEIDRRVKPTVYDVGIVGSWDEPNGFMGSSFRLHIGDYHGKRALPINFEFPSPLLIYKDSGGQTDLVECQGSKVLAIKESNDYPVCVDFDSLAKLIDRSWIKSDMQFLKPLGLKPVYYSDEEISFGVQKIGLENCEWITIKILGQDDDEPLLVDTAERTCLRDARDINSPEKSWRLHADFPQNKMESIILEPGDYVMQILSKGVTTFEREFRVIDEKINSKSPQSNTVHTTSIIQFGKMYDSKLLPIIYTVKIENTEKLDNVTFYDFLLLGINRGHGSNNWDFIPKQDRIFTQLVDKQGFDAIDRTRMPEHYVVDDVLRMHKLDCSGNTINAESGPEIILPIISELSQVTKIDSETGIYPDPNDRYTIEFASLYDTIIELPAEATTILYETIPCYDPNDPDNKFAQYTKVIFKLE